MITALVASALLWIAAPLPAKEVGPQIDVLVIAPDRAAEYRPTLRVGRILQDPALEEAARSGLPLRIQIKTELWRDGFFDSLEGSQSMTITLFYQPMEGRFVVRTTYPDRTEVRGFSSFSEARASVERTYAMDLRPRRDGKFYYTAALELETFSLSDLEELERWLKGELQPAVSGNRSVPGAVGQGAKRLLIRVLGLPARRFEARSEQFRIR